MSPNKPEKHLYECNNIDGKEVHLCNAFWCDGNKHVELGGKTVCEYIKFHNKPYIEYEQNDHKNNN